MCPSVSLFLANGGETEDLRLGLSGSGKSTLAQCLNGIIPNIHKGQASDP